MNYHPVTQYNRQRTFDFFKEYQNPFYAMTFNLDITELYSFCKSNDYSVYTNLCYLFTLACNQQEAFRYRILQQQLVLYEQVHIRATIPQADGHYSFVRLNFDPDIHDFNQEASTAVALAAREDIFHEERFHRNFIFFSAVPGTPFTGLTHAVRDNTDCEPRVSFGRFFEEKGRRWVPLGLQVNHMLIDGAHLDALYRSVQDHYLNPE